MVSFMDCIFCKIINNEIPSYTIYENEYVKCFLDVSPQSLGHTLIIPKKHFLDVTKIDKEYLLEVFEASKKIITILNNKLKPSGFVLTQNNGNVQQVKHYHLHVIPTYIDKPNKMDAEELHKLLTEGRDI